MCLQSQHMDTTFLCWLALQSSLYETQNAQWPIVAQTRKEYFQETSKVHVKPGRSDLCDTKEVHDIVPVPKFVVPRRSHDPGVNAALGGRQCVASNGHHPRMTCVHSDCYIVESLVCGFNKLLVAFRPHTSLLYESAQLPMLGLGVPQVGRGGRVMLCARVQDLHTVLETVLQAY
jgi:hypothetical protein